MTQPRQRYQCSADEAGHTPCVSRNGGATDALTRELSLAEQRYITAARAPNTLRGYRSDWAEFTTWCDHQHLEPLPAAPATVSSYLTVLAGYGAKVGTMSRRLSSVKFAHRAADLADPTANARVIAVWEGIRRTHAAPPEQAAPLMPPELWDVLDACPAIKTWKTRGRQSEPSLAGARDRALLIVGFVAALRRSEISALNIEDARDHPNGKVLTLPRSKANQAGDHAELVILPRSANPRRSPSPSSSTGSSWPTSPPAPCSARSPRATAYWTPTIGRCCQRRRSTSRRPRRTR